MEKYFNILRASDDISVKQPAPVSLIYRQRIPVVRFGVSRLLSRTTVFLMALAAVSILLMCSCHSRSLSLPYTGDRAEDKVYKNEKFGYTVSYPDRWFPSGIMYANAFEIRNYDPKNPQSVPEKNRASVIIVDMVNENAKVTDMFLDSLLTEKDTHEEEPGVLIIDGHRAVRILRKVPAQPLGKGVSRSLQSGSTAGQAGLFFSLETWIADGKHLISIGGSVPVEADASVLEEIKKIENSVRFVTQNSPEKKEG